MAASNLSPALSRRNAVLAGGAAGLLALGRGHPARAEVASRLDANKALVERIFADVINSGKSELLAELYAPGFVNRDTAWRQAPRPAGLPLPLDQFRVAFPAVQVTVESVVAEGDFVATRESWRDRHPPAGMHLVGRTMHLFRIAGGQIVEQWSAGWEWLEPRVEELEPGPANPLMSG